MARSAASDPIRDFKFVVEISPPQTLRTAMGVTGGGNLNLGFAVVSGISVTNAVTNYREGGMNTHPHKLVGQSDFAPVTFSRGVFHKQDQLYQWQQFIHAWNSGSLVAGGSNTGKNDYRCTVGVKVLDHPASGAAYIVDSSVQSKPVALPKMRIGYVLYNCWPGAFAMTDLNASSEGILVQQMTLHHEGFRLVNTDQDYTNAMNEQ